MTLKDKIINVISEKEIIDLTQELIKIPSHSDTPGREKKLANYIYKWFIKNGIDVDMFSVKDGRPNVVARIKGKKPGRALILNGHIDTVPPYDMIIDPFDPIIKAGKIYGRGSCDMKGSLAAMMMAMVALKRSGLLLNGEVAFTAVINEEMKSEGTEDVINRGIKADGAIVGEPTNLTIAAGHRGLEWLRVIIEGKAAHGGSPEKGINAISKAASFIREVEKSLLPKLSERVHPVVGEPALNFGVIQGGDQPSTVAGKCIIELDRRWTPDETLEQVFQDIYNIIDKLNESDPEFKAKLERVSTNMATMDHKPVIIDLDHPLVTILADIVEKVLTEKAVIGNLGGWTDASLLSNFGNIPSLNFGPGKMEKAHSIDEYIEIKQLLPATIIYAMIAIKF